MTRSMLMTPAVMAVVMLLPLTAAAQSEQVVYFHTDAIGSVRATTDSNGQEIARYDYLPFGQPPPGSPTSSQTRRFTGQERDASTSLDYFQARYYGAATGRFTTVDPEHVNGSIYDSQSWNAYAYGRNNPFRYADPTGTEYQICAFNPSGFGSSCGSVSDSQFDQIARNPGAGIRFDGNNIIANGVTAGYFRQTSIDPTFNGFISLTANTTVAYAKTIAVEYTKQAAISTATFGLGLAARVSIEVMLASRYSLVFKTGHYASRLLAVGVSVTRAEATVQQLIKSGAPLHGTVMVDGVVLEYRAMRLADGRINVGTIFPQR